MFRTLLAVVALVSLGGVVHPAHAVQGKPAGSPTTAAKPAASVAMVNINTASVAELDALPGVGSKTAALIVEYRQKNGPFKKIEELMNVRGVGEKSFLKLRAQISVGAPRAADHAGPQ